MNKIDLTPLVGSQVLMEFSNADEEFFKDYKPHVGFLSAIRGVEDELLYVNHREVNGVAFDKCRIYPDAWISNAERNVIIPDGLKCIAMYVSFEGERYVQHGETKNGQFFIDGKSEVRSQLHNAEHIKVIGPADGWAY